MPDHVHALITPAADVSLEKAIQVKPRAKAIFMNLLPRAKARCYSQRQGSLPLKDNGRDRNKNI
jgi:REP element-mobilizing transposase RayT